MYCFTSRNKKLKQPPLKILLVDDSSIILQRVEEMLNESLVIEEIKITNNGEDAILITQTFQPHLILLDICLPRKSGVKVLRHLKSNFPHIKIIMLTTQPADQYKDLCIQYGADAFMDKASDFESVPTIIKQLMAGEPV